MMNQEQLNAIKERVAKATLGPWESEETAEGHIDIFNPNEDYAVCQTGNETYDCLNDGDTEFIKHAITDVPVLVAEVERLQKRLEQTEKCYEIMEKATFKASEMLKETKNENERLRETLCFYGDLSKYVIIAHMNKETDLAVDLGEKARQALGGVAHE
ncbi:hypothetical protein M5J14_12530 [Lysinibacillus sp. OL1_EC]|uniref:hypothetical protein n=2 Tax=unclassified Lysinibacillus TaxID=2636778 RepID=UPI00187D5B10|nr:hypothetical protein [Lysinibacillus sp. OL1]MCM0625331.1 hypothetical protein [Lysinibacillus sp. OL1_EC]